VLGAGSVSDKQWRYGLPGSRCSAQPPGGIDKPYRLSPSLIQNKIDIKDGYFAVSIDVALGNHLGEFMAAIHCPVIFLLQ
jgi:hypothetical protein